MALAAGVTFNHVSRECADVKRLAQFYIELFGFEQVEAPKFEFDVIWLKLPTFFLHLIERDPNSRLPEGPWSSTSAVADIKHLRRGHHICFSISNLDAFVHTLKGKGIEVLEASVPGRNLKQVFFFDPEGNGLEVSETIN